MGDSLTEGFGLAIPPDVTYPNQVAALMGDQFTALNYGVGGKTAAQLISIVGASVNALYYPPQRQFVVVWAGTNDLYFGASAATTYSNIKALCQTFKNAGYLVVLLSILPRTNSGTPGTFETDRQTVNASLRSDFPTATGQTRITSRASYADYLIDIGDDPTIGQAGQTTNTTYYLDLVHLTSAGYAIPAEYVKKAIQLFP